VGNPANPARLAWRWRRARGSRAAWLLAPALVVPGLLALLDAEDAKPETHLRLLLNVDSELRRRAQVGGK